MAPSQSHARWRFPSAAGFLQILTTSYSRLGIGLWALVSLFVLNGDVGALPEEWLQRLTISSIQVAFLSAFLMRMRPMLWKSNRFLTLLTLVMTLSLLGTRLGAVATGNDAFTPNLGFMGIAPLLAGAMLVAALLSPTISVIGIALIAMGVVWAGNLPLAPLVAALVGGWSAALLTIPMRNRQHLIHAGAILSAVMTLLSAGFAIDQQQDWREVLNAAMWGAVSGTGAVALYWLGTALIERPFRLDTPLTLLELSSPEHPLQKQLREEAPGTYAHSLNVGMLAEAGAQAIGADSLLSRVGGYYHDIGKLKRPTYFIENQAGINSHERLTPNLSATIISAHVRDGVELARSHRLPARICEIIAQHHGTTIITYFYHQALGEGRRDPILEQHFRYEGPKPRSREAVLVMLADTVEAASRCIESPTPARLSSFIHDLFEMRRADGQFDESDLTFRDLNKIKEAFTRVLSAIHHQRVDYTEPPGPKSEAYVTPAS